MLKKFMVFTKPYKKELALSTLLAVLECGFEMIIPLIMAGIIDVGVVTGDRNYVLTRSGIMLLCGIAALILGAIYARVAAISSQGFGATLREAEYRKIQQFSFTNLDRFRTSSLVTRLTSDVTVLQNALASGIRPLIRGPVMMVMGISLAIFLNRTLALVFLVVVPILAVLLYVILRMIRPSFHRMQKALDDVNSVVQENLVAIRVVKSYVRGEYEAKKFSAVNVELKSVTERTFRTAAFNGPVFQLAMYGSIIAILWFGGNLIQSGGVQIGELTGFLSYVLQIMNSLMMISGVFMLLTRAMASAVRIMEVLDEPETMEDNAQSKMRLKSGSVAFHNVSFKYAENASEYVLKDISFQIKTGQTVGIIGSTGSGKSSLVQLISRLYDSTEGSVLVDDWNVRDYPLSHLHDTVGMVLQKNTLFSGTMRENLCWGNPDAQEEDLDIVCKIACADEFISRMSSGYESKIGQNGHGVSGGQKQRLCIARALLKRPKILILDDATSAVDTATEAKIHERLAKYLPNTTKIIIAQRILSVEHADQIIILNDGEIDEIGTHKSLLKGSLIYKEMHYAQQKGAEN